MLPLSTIYKVRLFSFSLLLIITSQHSDPRYWYGWTVCLSVCLSVWLFCLFFRR